MTVTLTDDPLLTRPGAPGHRNRLIRLKYVHLREPLVEIRDANASVGRWNCEICDYIEAHLEDDIIEVETFLWSHKEWGPGLLVETIRNAPRFNNSLTHEHGDEIAEAVQHDAALALFEYHPWARVRGPVEGLFRHLGTRFVSKAALYILLAHLNANHPNPRAFLDRPGIREKLPPDLDLKAFPAPDFQRP